MSYKYSKSTEGPGGMRVHLLVTYQDDATYTLGSHTMTTGYLPIILETDDYDTELNKLAAKLKFGFKNSEMPSLELSLKEVLYIAQGVVMHNSKPVDEHTHFVDMANAVINFNNAQNNDSFKLDNYRGLIRDTLLRMGVCADGEHRISECKQENCIWYDLYTSYQETEIVTDQEHGHMTTQFKEGYELNDAMKELAENIGNEEVFDFFFDHGVFMSFPGYYENIYGTDERITRALG